MAGKIAARQQLTDAPTIYIDIPDVSNLDNDLTKDRNTGEAAYHNATIKVVATTDVTSPHYMESFEETNPLDMEIKVRGNSTSSPKKRPYRIKFAKKNNSSDGLAHKHDMLGAGYAKRNWTLLANYFDRSMLRNALSYHLGKAIGMDFCPGYKFVDLVINGDYRGTYQVSDHCEADANRININEDTGWYLEAARNDMVEEPSVSAGGASWSIKNPEYDTEAETTQLKNDVTSWLNAWGNAINQYNYNLTSITKGWRAYSDEDSFVKFYLAINITGDYDGFMTVKAYRETDGKLFLGPLWDKDLAFGNYTGDTGTKLVEDYENGQLRYTIKGLMNDPLFVSKLKEKMDKLVANGLTENLCAKVDEIAELMKNTRTLNYQKWIINDATDTWGTDVTSTNYQDYVDAIKDYLRKHIPFIKEQVDATYASVVGNAAETTYNPDNQWYSQNLTMNKIVNETVQNRQLKGGKWNPICFPFSATQEQMEEALGCKYELKVHSGIAEDGETMLFTAPSTLDMTAAYPYLIKPDNDVNSMYFKGVMNSDGADQSSRYNGEGITFDNIHYFYGSLFTASYLTTSTDYQFANDVYTEGETLSHFTSAEIKGARAFIRVTNGSTPIISFGDDVIVPVVHQQLTDVPTIYLNTNSTLDADNWGTASIEVFDKNNMIGGNFTLDNTGLSIKYKGSATAEKPSYRLKFTVKRAFLGTKSGNYKQWVLEANDDDPTMLRNALTKELGDQMGFAFTPGYQFADVYVNDKYMGTYQITDRVKVESGRVLVSDKDTDWLVEIASSGEVDTRTDGNGDLYVAGDTNTPYLIIKNPDKDDLTTDQQTALANEVGTYFNTTFWNNIKDNVDQTSFINWYISTEILAAYKQLSSTYTYKSATDGKLFFGPLSGNEKAYDNNSKYPMDMTDLNTNGSYNGMIFTRADYGVMRNKLQDLWKEDWFKEAVLAKWNSIYGVNASTDVKAALKSKLTALSSEIAQTKAYNYKTTAEGGAGWTLEGSYDDQVSAISTYIDNRFAYLDKKFNELANAEDILMGDANGDGLINITDIVITVDYSLSNPSEAFHFKNADMNGDGQINITDVVQITDIILNAD